MSEFLLIPGGRSIRTMSYFFESSGSSSFSLSSSDPRKPSRVDPEGNKSTLFVTSIMASVMESVTPDRKW